MDDELSSVAQARLASGLTVDDAVRVTGLSERRYRRQEEHPFEFTLAELRALMCDLNADGRELLKAWLRSALGV